ncbi:MAG TPA: hypothetical protein PKY82_25430 [Pyrinomonadaceae bacterium]|nr:hypothetical protein [Pyrinomonadaceae bacterium]
MQNPTHCDRCGQKLQAFTMSMFNLDWICTICKKKETEHPAYKKACDAENAAVRAGVKNFPGIGCPKELLGGGAK